MLTIWKTKNDLNYLRDFCRLKYDSHFFQVQESHIPQLTSFFLCDMM